MEQKFDMHPALEAEMLSLAGEVQKRREGREMASQEALREAVGERIKPTVMPSSQSSSVSKTESTILPKYADDFLPEDKLFIEKIVDELWHDGNLSSAIKKVQDKGPIYADIFRDVLAGKLHDVLKQKGIL